VFGGGVTSTCSYTTICVTIFPVVEIVIMTGITSVKMR
jgi:hypothetical protein